MSEPAFVLPVSPQILDDAKSFRESMQDLHDSAAFSLRAQDTIQFIATKFGLEASRHFANECCAHLDHPYFVDAKFPGDAATFGKCYCGKKAHLNATQRGFSRVVLPFVQVDDDEDGDE